jgi:DNA mismatch repair ATPase MutS
MEYLIIGSIILILIFLVSHQLSKQKRKRRIEEIRSSWGRPKSESFHFVSIRKYADSVNAQFHRLTDQTLEDIDFNQLFVFIDRTTSRVGQQFLYKKLIEPTNSTKDSSEELTNAFIKNADLRETMQLELYKLNENDAYYISTLLQDRFLIEEPTWLKLLTLDIAIVVSLLALAVKFPVLLVFLIFTTTLNMFVHYWNKSNMFQFTRSIPQLNLLIQVASELLKKGDLLHDVSVKESISKLRSFQRKASLIKFDVQRGFQDELSQIGNYFLDIVKAFFLIEIIVFFKVMKELRDKQSSIITLFNYVGTIDAAIAVASLRAGKLKTCQPAFVPAKKELVVKNIYHPLIENCVKNNLSINNRSILITGSNMSGKSTFLRTLMINSILAQTIYTCFADEYISPLVKQFSSIRIDDNLFEGKSYYFQEVNVMASLLAEIKSPHQNLFVLDEVFKGTNTIERIASAKAILSYLNSNNNIVIVSTHDIELAGMLTSEYDLYHFTETIENNKLHFDHTIKSGQVRTRNAIKILELSNYPIDIINEARQISATLTTAKQ